MKTKFIFILGSCLMLGGCLSANMASLQAYVDEVNARKGGYIEPLPEIKPVERYLYQSANRRDPFSSNFRDDDQPSSVVIDTEQQRSLQREVRERNKEELEHFELDSLRMVGTLELSNALWGIVQDPDGTIYRVKKGNYMGRNYGKILSISEDKIELREIVKDQQGAWEERQASIAISDDEA